MGEYATRNKDGKEIKIGTCENMYYLRYSDRDKVSALPGNIDPMDESIISEIRWRLPFPDEDRGRGSVIPVIPQYERPDYGFCPTKTKDYAFRKEE